MTPYEIVKKACIEANPDILKLEFGCEGDYDGNSVKWLRYGMDFNNVDGPNVHVWQMSNGSRFVTPDNSLVQILGREIRLADVLLAFKRAHSDVWGKYWNLKHDSLSWHRDNKPETIEFLVKLLGKDE